MRLLIIHHEAEYFAGAEKMLGYFLEGITGLSEHRVTVAAARESRMVEVIPAGVQTCWAPANSKFSLFSYARQVLALHRHCRANPVDIVHGWAARDWELTALTGTLQRCPAIGLLHDHPQARFISRPRQRLMRWSAAAGLSKVVCVSEAVRQACLNAGYSGRKLAVVRNGLPPGPPVAPSSDPGVFRCGYLGVFSERKGLRTLFAMLEALDGLTSVPWEMDLAGDAQEEEGRRLVRDLTNAYSSKSWWPRVRWRGWVKSPAEFMASINLLICPSSDFDPFPTVVLEAGQAGVPVLGARVGGVPEMIEDAKTGWLFDSQDGLGGARILKTALETPSLAETTGRQAKKRVEGEFAMHRMVQEYLRLYTDLLDA